MEEIESRYSFRNLKVWQMAHQLTLNVYRTTASFPKSEVFGLVSQLRRASSSIGSNIAEGYGRKTNKDKARFYTIAMGSLFEVENHLLLSRDLDYINTTSYKSLSSDLLITRKLLSGLIRANRG
jgi:four helix bundle protein